MSDRYDDERGTETDLEDTSLERAAENVLDGWPAQPDLDDPPSLSDPLDADDEPAAAWGSTEVADESVETGNEPEPELPPAWASAHTRDLPHDDDSAESILDPDSDSGTVRFLDIPEHAAGELTIPPGVPVLEGEPRGERRAVGVVVSRFNGDVTTKLLESALAELEARGVATGSITVMPVPGAFELPLAAMALAKTRRFACVVALGCVIRGDTPHFDYVSSEAASGLQLAAIETGVPVAFGVLTLDRLDQAEARYGKGAEAVRTGLEMADLFANLRAAAAR